MATEWHRRVRTPRHTAPDTTVEGNHGPDTHTSGDSGSGRSDRHRLDGTAVGPSRTADQGRASVRDRGGEAVRFTDAAPAPAPPGLSREGQVGRPGPGHHGPVHLGGERRRQPDGRGRPAVPHLVHQPDLPRHALHPDLQVARPDRTSVFKDPGLRPRPVEPGAAGRTVRGAGDPAGQPGPAREPLEGRRRPAEEASGEIPALPSRAGRRLCRSGQSEHVLAGAAVRRPEPLRPRAGRVAGDGHIRAPTRQGHAPRRCSAASNGPTPHRAA